MGILQHLDTLRRSDKAHESNILSASLLDEVDGRNRTAAGSKHRVYNKNLPVLDICRQLAVILNRLVGVGVAVKPYMSNLGVGNQGQHTAVSYTHLPDSQSPA